MEEALRFWGILLLINVPTYFLVGSLFFRSPMEFLRALAFLLTPWWVSALRGEYDEDCSATFTLVLFILSCGAVVVAEYQVLTRYFPGAMAFLSGH
ncbi:MAG: hypothetical protein HUU16_09475 [Candidatus Omnitrophica bacterium]|nr:hypothetical protein [bacterium]NUN96391.1 hypothetical protein [Candidatus Omnitrophota bacterium]